MGRIFIGKKLEAKIRAKDVAAFDELIEKLGEETRETGSGTQGTGLGYRELVSLFRSHLGHQLNAPVKPDIAYVVKLLNRARATGVTKDNVEQICNGARYSSEPPFRLEHLVWEAGRYIERDSDRRAELRSALVEWDGDVGDSEGRTSVRSGSPANQNAFDKIVVRVFTGRTSGNDEEV